MYKKIVPLTLAMALSMPSLADEASVKKAVEGKLGGTVTSVTKTPTSASMKSTSRARSSTPTKRFQHCFLAH
jgi:hypothetical protein